MQAICKEVSLNSSLYFWLFASGSQLGVDDFSSQYSCPCFGFKYYRMAVLFLSGCCGCATSTSDQGCWSMPAGVTYPRTTMCTDKCIPLVVWVTVSFLFHGTLEPANIAGLILSRIDASVWKITLCLSDTVFVSTSLKNNIILSKVMWLDQCDTRLLVLTQFASNFYMHYNAQYCLIQDNYRITRRFWGKAWPKEFFETPTTE